MRDTPVRHDVPVVVTVSGARDVTGLEPDVDAVVPIDLRFAWDSVDEVRTGRLMPGGAADFIKVIATGGAHRGTTPPRRVQRG